MSDKYEKLNDTFDVEASEVSKEIVEKKIDKIESSVEDIKKIMNIARGNLYSVIEKDKKAS